MMPVGFSTGMDGMLTRPDFSGVGTYGFVTQLGYLWEPNGYHVLTGGFRDGPDAEWIDHTDSNDNPDYGSSSRWPVFSSFSAIFNRKMQKLPLFSCILIRNEGKNGQGV